MLNLIPTLTKHLSHEQLNVSCLLFFLQCLASIHIPNPKWLGDRAGRNKALSQNEHAKEKGVRCFTRKAGVTLAAQSLHCPRPVREVVLGSGCGAAVMLVKASYGSVCVVLLLKEDGRAVGGAHRSKT